MYQRIRQPYLKVLGLSQFSTAVPKLLHTLKVVKCDAKKFLLFTCLILNPWIQYTLFNYVGVFSHKIPLIKSNIDPGLRSKCIIKELQSVSKIWPSLIWSNILIVVGFQAYANFWYFSSCQKMTLTLSGQSGQKRLKSSLISLKLNQWHTL